MSVARSDIDTELSSPSPESLLSELSDRDEPYEVQHHYSSPGTSWSGSGATTNTALDGVSSNGESINVLPLNMSQPVLSSARVGLTGFPYASSGQEIPFLNSSPGHGVYPMHQQPSSSSAWSNSTWPYMDNLDARGPSQWGSAQETAYISPLDYDDMSEQQGVATHGSETAPTLHTPPQENPIVRTNYAGQVGIQYNNDLVQDHAPPTANTQRTKEDQILLEGKRAGLTYKEIKRQMNSKVAESTLRGRYRSLTKERKDRVRKPVWTTNDVCLES
jgi:hypothetical protein